MGRPRKKFSLARTFLASRVLALQELAVRLGCSQRTILRRLKEHGYYSSYNCRGNFITLEEIPRFDSRGLWVWKGARFSRRGTLKDTVLDFVGTSRQGMTHEELSTILGVRVHDTLLDLVREEEIRRQRLGSTFVYFSYTRSVEKKQIRRRKDLLKKRRKPRATSRQRIATLLELIKDPKATRQDIVHRCKGAGTTISRDVVDVIFEVYDLDKKGAP